jgi:predicted alpha/beta-fold hydrolase
MMLPTATNLLFAITAVAATLSYSAAFTHKNTQTIHTFSVSPKLSHLQRTGLVMASSSDHTDVQLRESSAALPVKSQEQLRKIVSSFSAQDFVPQWGLFGLAANAHWQTIVGSESIRTKLFGEIPCTFETRKERFRTPDEDFFDVEFTDNFDSSERVVFLLHGLESNCKGPLITKMTRSFMEKGFGCGLVSFRGCNGEDNDTLKAYHLGFTDDIKQLTRVVHDRYPNKRIYLSGFSLGGNVIMKFFGELGDNAPELGIAGGVTTCVPFDLIKSSPLLSEGIGKYVYSRNFLNSIIAKAEIKNKRFPGVLDMDRIRACQTMADIDDAFISPIFGFEDRHDYHRTQQSKGFLPKIRVPTIAINACDDPFIDEGSLPTSADIGEAPVRCIYHEYGGHCGFIAKPGSAGSGAPWGWLAEEMGKALVHIDDSIQR